MKGNNYAIETLVILKELARHFTVTVNFADAEMRKTGEPVFSVKIDSAKAVGFFTEDIEFEEPLEEAIRMIKYEVDQAFKE
jgi:hypothetical protein